MDFIAVAFELSPLLFLLTSKKAWRAWILIACLFHTFNTLMLNINFISIGIIYLAFADFTHLFNKIKYFYSLKLVKPFIYLCLSLIIFIRINYSINSITATNIFLPGNLIEINLYFAIIIWIIILSLFISSFKKTALDIHNS